MWTGKGDDGTTGLLFGGRVRKDDDVPAAFGAVDETQAFIGLARAETPAGSALNELLVAVERHLYVLMAELATAADNHGKLADGTTRVSQAMLDELEAWVDDVAKRFTPPTEFVLPGQNRSAALLDVARTVARRAERHAVSVAVPGSLAVPYLNRLSTLLWTLARSAEGESLAAKSTAPTEGQGDT